jgi:hypothetical protein
MLLLRNHIHPLVVRTYCQLEAVAVVCIPPIRPQLSGKSGTQANLDSDQLMGQTIYPWLSLIGANFYGELKVLSRNTLA